MVAPLVLGAASLIGNQGNPNDPNIGRADPLQGGLSGGFKDDPRSTAQKVLDPAAVFLKGKSKFKKFTPKTLSELVGEARGVFSQNQQGFISEQINAQRSNFGSFFDQRDATVAQGQGLIERLTTGDLERRLSTQSIRGAQAARGLSLGPAAAIQEGLAVAEAQQRSEFQALQLGQNLAQFSASTPLQLQQLDFTQLLGTARSQDLATGGFQTDAQISNINLQRDRETQGMGLLGRGLGSLGSQPQVQGTSFGGGNNLPDRVVNVQTQGQAFGAFSGPNQSFSGPGQGFGNFSGSNQPRGSLFNSNFSGI